MPRSACPHSVWNRTLYKGCIAGGDRALRTAIEGCEDDAALGKMQIAGCGVTAKDVVVGISASGSAPFVIGALSEARKRGAATVAVVNNAHSRMKEVSDICIEAVTGPEVISGSTRMKAGTAQKMILNMLSTAVMIKLGKVYGNMMVDLKASNKSWKTARNGSSAALQAGVWRRRSVIWRLPAKTQSWQ